jgi:hypothetical protein
MGSYGDDYGRAIAVDSGGNVYVAGYSNWTWGTPVNAFAAKLNSNGVRQWNTFMGSGGDDFGYAIAVDSGGNVYVAGNSYETWGTPVNALAGGKDAFAAKLNSGGVRQWNTFMGSGGDDSGYSIAVDSDGNTYVAGTSLVTWGTPINPHGGGGYTDAFAAKLYLNGARLWNTFMGSDRIDEGHAIAVDSSGNVYVAGMSFKGWGKPIINLHAGSRDAFAVKITVPRRVDILGTWPSGVWYRDSETGFWVKIATSANMVAAGDIDADGIDDVIGVWNSGLWVKHSSSGGWVKLSSSLPDHIASGDMNGDGRDDVVATWTSSGVWY